MPKALVPVLGEPLLLRAVRGLIGSGCVHHAIVAAPPDAVEEVRAAVAPAGGAVHVVPGGSQRTESVRCALAESARVVPDAAVVLVHDAARAFTPASVIREVVCAVRDGADAVVPVLPVADTIKQVDADDRVTVTVDRARLRSVQTPQGFTPEVLHEAYAAVGDAATDDAGLVERLGRTVATVSGHPQALKITTAFDLAIAEAVLAEPFPGRDRP